MSESVYPRDLIGYGQHVPNANWPGDAKIAVQFVLNYEEGGETGNYLIYNLGKLVTKAPKKLLFDDVFRNNPELPELSQSDLKTESTCKKTKET